MQFLCSRTSCTSQWHTHFCKPAAFCYWTLWDLEQQTSFPYTVWQHNLLMSESSRRSRSCVKRLCYSSISQAHFSHFHSHFDQKDLRDRTNASVKALSRLLHGDYFSKFSSGADGKATHLLLLALPNDKKTLTTSLTQHAAPASGRFKKHRAVIFRAKNRKGGKKREIRGSEPIHINEG